VSRIERKPELETKLKQYFSAMLDKYRAAVAAGLVEAEKPAPKGRRPSRGPKKSAPPAA
jgi:hypothetical protein